MSSKAELAKTVSMPESPQKWKMQQALLETLVDRVNGLEGDLSKATAKATAAEAEVATLSADVARLKEVNETQKLALETAIALVTEEREAFASFLTQICAIIGGVFTVTGLLDSVVYHAISGAKKLS